MRLLHTAEEARANLKHSSTGAADIACMQMGLAVALFILVFAARECLAADPQPYRVVLAPAGSAERDEVLKSSSLLVTLQKSAPVPPFGLITRANGDIDRLTIALNSLGFYEPRIRITIVGLAASDPTPADGAR